jgi:hypothetical protein
MNMQRGRDLGVGEEEEEEEEVESFIHLWLLYIMLHSIGD